MKHAVMDRPSHNASRPLVQLVGAVDHPDFRDAVTLLRATAHCDDNALQPPEVVVVAESRPGQTSQLEIQSLQNRWPLAGVIAILGSWCEGELRTGRPWPGVRRFYWYEFTAWWRQQLASRAAGRCPEWARPVTDLYREPLARHPHRTQPPGRAARTSPRGLIQLGGANRDTADVLAEVLQLAGFATVWSPPHLPTAVVRGAFAGVWDGGQLDDRELPNLAAFCRSLAHDPVPVVALLDFPRHDRCEGARQMGVAAVLAKPWINTDLIEVLGDVASRHAAATHTRRDAA